MPGSEAVSTLHWPKNDILSFFKILQKKVPGLTKKLMHISCKLQKSSFNKCRKFLLSSLETFFCKNLINLGMSSFGRCNVETASLAQTLQGLRVVCSKRATFFVYWVTQLVDLSYLVAKRIRR